MTDKLRRTRHRRVDVGKKSRINKFGEIEVILVGIKIEKI